MPERSILTKVDDLINKELGLEVGRLKYKHKKTCQLFSKGIHPKIRWEALIRNVLEQINSNWNQEKCPSEQNWRWKKNYRIDPENSSPEVILERSIVRTTGKHWVNQVPVASGLTGSNADKRRAIDLVHRCGKKDYEFIELKVGSDTPLFAAMEILQYGIIYIFSRDNSKRLGYTEDGVLGASGIYLRVLAPAAYYEGYDLAWLKEGITDGIARFLTQGERRYKLKMDFEFESFALSSSPALIPARSLVNW